MPSKKKHKKASEGEPGQWVLDGRASMQDEEHDYTEPKGRVKKERWAAETRFFDEEDEEDGASGASRPEHTHLEKMALRYKVICYKAQSALLAWEPSIKTTMVCGRPVQVHLGT